MFLAKLCQAVQGQLHQFYDLQFYCERDDRWAAALQLSSLIFWNQSGVFEHRHARHNELALRKKMTGEQKY